MTEDQIKHMVSRFLGWRLPKDFRPDAGISYTRPNYLASVDATPSGTNLFDANQADAMVRYMIDGMPASNAVEHPRERADLWVVAHRHTNEALSAIANHQMSSWLQHPTSSSARDFIAEAIMNALDDAKAASEASRQEAGK